MDEQKKFLEAELVMLAEKIAEAEKLAEDPTLAEMAKTELAELKRQAESLRTALEGPQAAMEPVGDQADDFNKVILEVRPGVGGEEAKIWAEDLLRMYTRYANSRGYKAEEMDDGVLRITGAGVFQEMKYETGVHRVQRVPETEAQGRIHTSTASVVALPEVPESIIEVREDDLLWEFSRGGGHGGQNVNKVATAVRLTHKPTGVIAQARQERSQEQNRKIALSLLRSLLWEAEQERKQATVAGQRAAIGRSMRSEKIRTYNYPQNRVTDHRIGKSWHKLEKIMEGDLGDVLEAMKESV